MQPRLSDGKICTALSRAIRQDNLISIDDTAVIFYDLSFLSDRIHDLVGLFPKDTLHAIAVKANPLRNILNKISALGVGLEAASLPELHIATSTGLSPNKVVFDSPAKTMQELRYALKLGVHVNADSLLELERIDGIIGSEQSKSTIGVRINPQVGTGKILSTSVAGDYSKFGIPLNEHRKELKEKFLKYDWLRGVHLHIGSQGCKVEMLVAGVERVLDFVHEVNDNLQANGSHRKINIFDIGGGLPVSYDRNDSPVSMSQYKEELETRFPELFSPAYQLITEFGRYIQANIGWVASKVEHVKRGQTVNTAMIHVGADLFLRECYNPHDWHHEIIVVDQAGKMKTGKADNPYFLAGPLCFAGDLVAREISLPEIEAGDYVVIQDTGAYTLSMWSRYNSRQMPKVIGYYQDGNTFEVIRDRESIEDILNFWA